MMHPRWLALPLAVLTASASVSGCATTPAPRMLSADLHIGSLDDRTSFELDEPRNGRSASTDEGVEEGDDLDERVDTPRKQRIRRLLYITGLSAIGFGVVGTVAFGVGGRIVQAQMKNGYEDGDLTRAREDQLSTAGTAMNALAITSAAVGLAGVILAATVYGVDHARCGNLRPRRKQCPPEQGASSGVTTGGGTAGTPSNDASASPGGAADEASGSGDPSGSSDASTGAPGGTGPAASPPGTGPAPVGPAPATEGPATTEPGPSPAGGKPSTGGKRASSPSASPGQ